MLDKKMREAGITGKRSLIKNFLLRNEFVCTNEMLFGQSNMSSSSVNNGSKSSSTTSLQQPSIKAEDEKESIMPVDPQRS